MGSINEELRKAAEMGDEAGLEALLLRPKCDPMSKNEDGRTALMLAALKEHSDCVHLLLPASDALAKDERGITALMWAASFGRAACVQLLLPGSDALAKDNTGLTASDRARAGGHASLGSLIDAYALALSEMSDLRSSTGPGATRKTSSLRV